MTSRSQTLQRAAEQSLAADGAIACFSSNLFPLSSDADRAPQLGRRYAESKMSDDKRKIHCEAHGDQQETFVCQHVVQSLHTRESVGFWWAADRGNNRPDAWCTACKEVLREENDEWTARAESFANIRLLCGICYDSARELNFPTWRQFFPGST